MATVTDRKNLPKPVFDRESPKNSILFLAREISSGDWKGVNYSVVHNNLTFEVHVKGPGGEITERLELKNMINAWVTSLANEVRTPDEAA
jgi:hypothetical protein